MTVKELIAELSDVQNQDATVYIFLERLLPAEEPLAISMVDDGFGGDRVDINVSDQYY